LGDSGFTALDRDRSTLGPSPEQLRARFAYRQRRDAGPSEPGETIEPENAAQVLIRGILRQHVAAGLIPDAALTPVARELASLVVPALVVAALLYLVYTLGMHAGRVIGQLEMRSAS
jgi:hypothetical protein